MKVHYLFVVLVLAAVGDPGSLKAGGPTDLYEIQMEVADKDYGAIQAAKPTDVEFSEAKIRIDGTDYLVESIHTRGKSSLLQRRKSYTVELASPVSISFGKKSKEMDAFYLISMSMDKNYYRNRLSFECLAHLGIYPMSFRYVNLTINAQHEGVYLLVQRPFDCLIDEIGSPYALRRLKSGVIDKDATAPGLPEDEADAFRQNFKSIVKTVRRLEGEDLYNTLDGQLNMTSYFRWLAFNYLIRNGDYTDEVHYYIVPGDETGRFDIVPWDFDDILKKGPHEGVAERDRILGEKIIFSSEDILDRIIAGDAYMYSMYLKEVRKVCDLLSDEFLSLVFNRILADLTPYFQNEDVIAASKYDSWGPTNLEELQEELASTESYLISRKNAMLHYCESNGH